MSLKIFVGSLGSMPPEPLITDCFFISSRCSGVIFFIICGMATIISSIKPIMIIIGLPVIIFQILYNKEETTEERKGQWGLNPICIVYHMFCILEGCMLT